MSRYDIHLTDDVIEGVFIENYNAQELSEELNNMNKKMIAIGEGDEAIIVQRFSVIKVIPSK